MTISTPIMMTITLIITTTHNDDDKNIKNNDNT